MIFVEIPPQVAVIEKRVVVEVAEPIADAFVRGSDARRG